MMFLLRIYVQVEVASGLRSILHTNLLSGMYVMLCSVQSWQPLFCSKFELGIIKKPSARTGREIVIGSVFGAPQLIRFSLKIFEPIVGRPVHDNQLYANERSIRRYGNNVRSRLLMLGKK